MKDKSITLRLSAGDLSRIHTMQESLGYDSVSETVRFVVRNANIKPATVRMRAIKEVRVIEVGVLGKKWLKRNRPPFAVAGKIESLRMGHLKHVPILLRLKT